MAELWNDYLYSDVMVSDGYVVEYALFTTYSLDLSTMLAIPFTLGTMGDFNQDIMKSHHLLLEAVNRAADRFAVFCNAGCIGVPKKHSKVYSLLEKSIVQISLQQKGKGFINFHPKVWVIKERNPETGERQIKVVVLSRNLTNSYDLDMVCAIVGKINPKPASELLQKKHQPLVDFIDWLGEKAQGKIKKEIRKISDDIKHIKRFDIEEPMFVDYDFFPMGIDNYDGLTYCLGNEMLWQADEMVIVSPFIDKKTLAKITACSPKSRKSLITRHASISNDVLKMLNDGVYAPKEVLTDLGENGATVDLHAKAYFIRNFRDGRTRNNLYVGSTNATQNGFGRNVEFLLRLTFGPNHMSYDKFKKELIYDSNSCMFEPVDQVPDDEAQPENPTIELMLRQAISAIDSAEVVKNGKNYRIIIHCKDSRLPSAQVDIHPFGSDDKESKLCDGLVFDGIALDMLTEFYVMCIGALRRVVKIKTKNIPLEQRDMAIFRSLINTPRKFIDYLTFMLSDDPDMQLLESQQLDVHTDDVKQSPDQMTCLALYENMVRKAYQDPDQILAISHVLHMADPSVIPDNFKEMYNHFNRAAKHLRRR